MTSRQQTQRRRKLEVTDLDLVRSGLDDEYEILAELGRGGMGIVYRARERQLEREVAIKVLPFTLAFDRELVERFLREARTAAQLEHTNIVPIYRVGRRGDVIFFVMKLLRGLSLADRLRTKGRISAGETRQLLIETASALGYAHRHGVVHRDVKPDNLRHDEDGRCVVTDFGIARSAGSSRLTTTGMSVGTPKYMSPEQARAKEVDGRSDIYSLGVVAYECLAGHTPFDGGDALAILMKHIQSPLPKPPLDSDEDWALYTVVEKMLAKHPEDRYRDADELIAALGGRELIVSTGEQRRWNGAPTPPLGGFAASQPTVPLAMARVPGADEGPAPAPALDAAFDAGIRLLRGQSSKLRAVLAPMRRIASVLRPSLGAAASLARRWTSRVAPRVMALFAAVTRWTVAATTRAKPLMTSGGSTVWVASIGTIAAGVLFVTAFRATVGRHPSRCAAVAVTAEGKAHPLALLVDSLGTARRGSDLDVRYDICGLEQGMWFRTKMSVVRTDQLRRANPTDRVSANFEDTAQGDAIRRQHTMAIGSLPAGSYRLGVLIIDERGRRRERELFFEIAEK